MYMNKVFLLGKLGKDPIISFSKSGDPIAKFSLATTQSSRNKATGEYVNKTDWHNLVAFKKTAEYIQKYITKGCAILVEASLHNHNWVDKDNKKHYDLQLIVEQVSIVLKGNLASNQQLNNSPEPINDVNSPVPDFQEDDNIPF